MPFEIQLRVALDAIDRALRIHDVGVGLLAAFYRGWRAVDRVLVGVAVAQLLSDEVFDQLAPLVGGQFAGKCHLNFPIGRAVRPLELISRFPKVGGVVLGPGRHVAAPRGLQVFIALIAAVLALPGDVRGVVRGLAFAADFHRAVIRGHALPLYCQAADRAARRGHSPRRSPRQGAFLRREKQLSAHSCPKGLE